MAARTELKIVWDGPVKGLDVHRVSLTKFGPALGLLMTAARRIASQKLQDAAEPTRVGRLLKAAENLDIELGETVKGSGGFATVITFEAPDTAQSLMFNQIPELVGKELLESIKSEASGTHRNSHVRNYLRSLPKELTRQDYDLHENGRSILHVELRSVSLPEEINEPLPELRKMRGRVTGVGFDPGRFEVKIRGEDGSQVTAFSTEAQVLDALAMRAGEVDALTLASADGNKLIMLENEFKQTKRPTLDDIFLKWGDTYRALA